MPAFRSPLLWSMSPKYGHDPVTSPSPSSSSAAMDGPGGPLRWPDDLRFTPETILSGSAPPEATEFGARTQRRWELKSRWTRDRCDTPSVRNSRLLMRLLVWAISRRPGPFSNSSEGNSVCLMEPSSVLMRRLLRLERWQAPHCRTAATASRRPSGPDLVVELASPSG